MNFRFKSNLEIALNAISQNKLRSLLTALGIIFGVSAVIAMLSIGNGAKEEILKQLEIIGTNNIVIEALVPEDQKESEGSTESSQKPEEKKMYSPGLNKRDVKILGALIPQVKSISLEVKKRVKVIYSRNSSSTICRGVNNDFFDINNLTTESGTFFSTIQVKNGMNVCIIGPDLAKTLFLGKDPIGHYIKVQNVILKVIGVLKKRMISKINLEKLNVSSFSHQVFVPIETFFLRFEDRAYVSKEDVKINRQDKKITNHNQLDKVVIKIEDVNKMEQSASLVQRILLRRHNDQRDFTVEVPELLIKQQQNTQETLNLVFAIIAGISLLVGGIGIMNIMLSSVLERVKEIGIRRSLGAKKRDITFQFLLEAVLISLVGGILGILLGVLSSEVIGRYAEINAIVSLWSIFISFIISFSVGLFFGYMPAQKAANLDPILAIRT